MTRKAKALMNVPVVNSLTPAAIQTMHRMDSSDDDLFFVPTVQVYRIKRNVCDGGDNWSVSLVMFLYFSQLLRLRASHRHISPTCVQIALSDGQFFTYGLCDAALSEMIHSHDIAQNAIIRVYKFQMTIRKYQGRNMKVVLLMDAEKAHPNPGYPVGTPVNIQGDRNDTEASPCVDLSLAMAMTESYGPHGEASRDAFISTSRMRGRWQHDYRDFYHRRDMVKTL